MPLCLFGCEVWQRPALSVSWGTEGDLLHRPQVLERRRRLEGEQVAQVGQLLQPAPAHNVRQPGEGILVLSAFWVHHTASPHFLTMAPGDPVVDSLARLPVFLPRPHCILADVRVNNVPEVLMLFQELEVLGELGVWCLSRPSPALRIQVDHLLVGEVDSEEGDRVGPAMDGELHKPPGSLVCTDEAHGLEEGDLVDLVGQVSI